MKRMKQVVVGNSIITKLQNQFVLLNDEAKKMFVERKMEA